MILFKVDNTIGASKLPQTNVLSLQATYTEMYWEAFDPLWRREFLVRSCGNFTAFQAEKYLKFEQ